MPFRVPPDPTMSNSRGEGVQPQSKNRPVGGRWLIPSGVSRGRGFGTSPWGFWCHSVCPPRPNNVQIPRGGGSTSIQKSAGRGPVVNPGWGFSGEGVQNISGIIPGGLRHYSGFFFWRRVAEKRVHNRPPPGSTSIRKSAGRGAVVQSRLGFLGEGDGNISGIVFGGLNTIPVSFFWRRVKEERVHN